MEKQSSGKKTGIANLPVKKQHALYKAIIDQKLLEEADVETPDRCCESKKKHRENNINNGAERK
jgi:hypothetical protein